MLNAAQLRLAIQMLSWSHAELLAFVAQQSQAEGGLELAEALPEPVEAEIVAAKDADGWDVSLVAQPVVRPKRDDDAAARFLVTAIARRAERLVRLARLGLEAPHPPTTADAAYEEGMHVNVVDRIVRGRVLAVDGRPVRFESLIDPDAVVETTRREALLEALLAPCCDAYGLGDASRHEWPNNVLSTRTIALEGGVIGRDGDDALVARYEPAERTLCERLAFDARTVANELPIGMQSEAEFRLEAFYLVAPPDGRTVPAAIDEAFVRALFGGTISPLDAVRVEPFDASGAFLAEVDAEHLSAWHALVAHFASSTDLACPTFVSIGFFESAPSRPIPDAQRPVGFASRGSCLPRLVFGVTPKGSVVGLFGHVVWT